MKKIDSKTARKPLDDKRILARRVAREMTAEELHSVTGGTTSCSGGGGDDCDQQQQ